MSNTLTTTPHPADSIYTKVLNELKLPNPIPEQFGITREAIRDAYNQCITYRLTHDQAEKLIIKMWKNSIQIK